MALKAKKDKEHSSSTAIADQLANIFPTLARSELVARAESCADVNVLIDQLVTEQSLSSKVLSRPTNKLETLMNLFPGKSLSELQRALKENNDDITSASNSFFEEPVTQEESSMELLQRLTTLEKKEVSSFFKRNLYDVTQTIIDVTFNFKQHNDLNPSSLMGGRVQGGAGRRIDSRFEKKYNYNKDSTEAKELRSLYSSNPQFKKIAYEFFEKALVLHKGNVDRVLEMALFVARGNGPELTHKFSNTTSNKNLLSEVLARTPRYNRGNQKPEPKISLAREVQFSSIAKSKPGSQSSNKSNYLDDPVLVDSRWRSFDQTGVLDLHMLSSAAAKDLAGRAASQWWHRELNARELDGNLHRFGSRASFEPPLRVVTGRGLHSVDGRAKVKNTVKKYLENNAYTYDEEMGSVSITGKNIRH